MLVDRPDGWYAAPPALPDGAGGLVSTVDDLAAFAAMLAADGGGLLSPESVAQLLRDRTTARDRAENPWFFGEHLGWGLTMSVPPPASTRGPYPAGLPRGYGWEGGSGTAWRTDPATGLTGILLTQRLMTSPEPPRGGQGLLVRRLRRAGPIEPVDRAIITRRVRGRPPPGRTRVRAVLADRGEQRSVNVPRRRLLINSMSGPLAQWSSAWAGLSCITSGRISEFWCEFSTSAIVTLSRWLPPSPGRRWPE